MYVAISVILWSSNIGGRNESTNVGDSYCQSNGR